MYSQTRIVSAQVSTNNVLRDELETAITSFLQTDGSDLLDDNGYLAATFKRKLKAALSSTSESVRCTALSAISLSGEAADDLQTSLREHLEQDIGLFERALTLRAAARTAAGSDSAWLTQELIELLGSGEEIRTVAQNGITFLGEKAKGQLTEALKGAEGSEAIAIVELLGELGGIGSADAITEKLLDDNSSLRAAAAEALGEIGPEAAQSAETIASLLMNDKDEQVRATAALALPALNPNQNAVEALVSAVSENESQLVSRSAADALSQIAESQTVSSDQISQLVRSGQPEAMEAAIRFVSNDPVASLPLVIKLLKSPKTSVFAAFCIGECGSEARPYVSELLAAKRKADPVVNTELSIALGKIGDDREQVLEALGADLNHKSISCRVSATLALGQVGKVLPRHMTLVKANERSGDSALELLSAWVIAKVDNGNPLAGFEAAKRIALGMQSDNPSVREAAALCIADVQKDLKALPAILPQVLQALDQPEPPEAAVDMLVAICETSVGQELFARTLAEDNLRPLSVRVAAQRKKNNRDVQQQLVKALEDERQDVRMFALEALANEAANSQLATDAILETAENDKSWEVRRAATRALGQALDSPRVRATLVKALANLRLRDDAASALSNLAGEDPDVTAKILPLLKRNVSAENSILRRDAITALGNLPITAEIKDALRRATMNSDRAIRKAASDALESAK